MVDQIMATISLLSFVIFMVVLAVYINEFDLWLIVAAVVMMAATDFVHTLREDGNGSRSNKF
jgi:hypothetical protein